MERARRPLGGGVAPLLAAARERAPRAHAAADLKDVTFIDEAGQDLLGDMYGAGAEFLAAGAENTQVLANLKEKGKGCCGALVAVAKNSIVSRALAHADRIESVWKNAGARRAPAVANSRSKGM